MVTANRDAALASAARLFANYNRLPSYRAILDVEGAADPTGASIVGDESAVDAQLDQLAAIGVTDLCAAPFPVPEDPEALERTFAFLAERARGGG